MQAYANKMGIDANGYELKYDGEPIAMTETPESLGMEEGESVDVLLKQVRIATAAVGTDSRTVACCRLDCTTAAMLHTMPATLSGPLLRRREPIPDFTVLYLTFRLLLRCAADPLADWRRLCISFARCAQPLVSQAVAWCACSCRAAPQGRPGRPPPLNCVVIPCLIDSCTQALIRALVCAALHLGMV